MRTTNRWFRAACVILLAAAVSLGTPLPCSAALNLIPNPSFETAGAGSLPSGWVDAVWGGTGTIQRVATNYHEGGWSLEIKPGAHTNYVAATQANPLPVAGGVTYRLRVYAKSLVPQPEAHVRINYFDANDRHMFTQYVYLPVGSAYEGTYEALVPAPVAAKACRVNLYVKGNGTGANSAWFDSVLFQAQSEPVPPTSGYPIVRASSLANGQTTASLPRIPTTIDTYPITKITEYSCILVDDAGNVYYPNGAGAFSYTSQGVLRWSITMPQNIVDLALRNDGTLVVCSDNEVRAVNAQNGATVWSTAISAPGGAAVNVSIAPDGRIYVLRYPVYQAGNFVGSATILSPDGTPIGSINGPYGNSRFDWHERNGAQRLAIDASGNVYFIAYDIYESSCRVKSVTSTGQQRWQTPSITTWSFSNVSLSPDGTKVYVAEGGRSDWVMPCPLVLKAYNAQNGNLLWAKTVRQIDYAATNGSWFDRPTIWAAQDAVYVNAQCSNDWKSSSDRYWMLLYKVASDGGGVLNLLEGRDGALTTIPPGCAAAYANGYFAAITAPPPTYGETAQVTVFDSAGNISYAALRDSRSRYSPLAIGKDGTLYVARSFDSSLHFIGSLPVAPTAAVGSTTSTTATFAWNPLGEALGYRVYDTSGNLKATLTYHNTSFTETGLAPNAQVVRDIATYNAIGTSAAKTRVTLITQAAQPTTPTFSSMAQTSAKVSWGANGNPTGTIYELSRNGTVVYTGQNLAYSDSGLQPGTQYVYKVRAKNQANQWTSAISASVRTIPPTAPAPTVQSSGGLPWSQTAGRGYVVLTWPAQTGATGYKLWVYDGYQYRAFDVGSATTWDSRAARIYPSEDTLKGFADNSQSVDLFNHAQGGLDLRDTPNYLYNKIVGTSYDTNHNYAFRVSTYNESGESPLSGAATPTLPNRTDIAPPSGSLSVDGGAQYTSALTVALGVSGSDPLVANYTAGTSDDASGVAQMQFSNDNTIWSPWEPFVTGKSWTLAPGEGTKTVYARVRDAAGNVSATFSKEIYLFFDSQGPNVQMKINDGSPLTSKTGVTLSLMATDNFSGTPDLQMRFSNNWTTWSDWESYRATRQWDIPSGDGSKVVYCQVKDKAGNVTTVYGLVTLSTQPPRVDTAKARSAVGTSGVVYVSENPVNTCFVNARKVEMILNPAQTGSMRFSLDGLSWSEPEAALGAKTFSLPDVDGQHTVYVRFGDGQTYIQEFTLDRTPPVVEASWLGGATVTNNKSATLILNSKDNVSRQEDLQYSVNGGAWTAFSQKVTVNVTGTGYQTVTVMVRDQARNIAREVLSIYNK